MRAEKVIIIYSVSFYFIFCPSGNVLAVCMCSHASIEYLYTWFHKLQQDYPVLKDAAAVYNVFLDQNSNTDSARLSIHPLIT